MSAKSAPQLPVSPLNHARGTALHARGTFVVFTLALLMGAAAWLLDLGTPQLEPLETAAPAPLVVPPEPLTTVSGPAPAPAAAQASERPPENSRYRALAQFLAKRYKVSQAVTHDLVTIAHAAGHQIGVDPLLIIAVMAVESRFNPIAESVAGAKGLMQIIPRYHTDKFHDFGGVKAVFDPQANILVGSQIIKEYLARTGNLNSALQLYGGVSNPQNDVYFDKVMTEKQRLMQVLNRKS